MSDKNPFYSQERVFPVDLGSPVAQNYSFRVRIPDGYSISEKPSDFAFSLGNGGGKFEYTCAVDERIVSPFIFIHVCIIYHRKVSGVLRDLNGYFFYFLEITFFVPNVFFIKQLQANIKVILV